MQGITPMPRMGLRYVARGASPWCKSRRRRLHQPFQDVQRSISDPLAEDESLIPREAVQPLQQPLGHIIPNDQQDRRLIATWSHALRHFSKTILAALGCKG
jgi:hypothetical protein